MADSSRNHSEPLRVAHVTISGFLQSTGESTGISRAYSSLRQKHNSRASLVVPCAWNDNWDDLAELLWRESGANGDTLRVGIYAYSWGGASAMILARALAARGIGVRAMVLSDPVYRSAYWWGWWKSRFRFPRIVVPAMTREVVWFRQSMNWPAGHDLIAERPKTKENPRGTLIHPAEWARRYHNKMDEMEPFQMAIREMAKRIAREAGECPRLFG